MNDILLLIFSVYWCASMFIAGFVTRGLVVAKDDSNDGFVFLLVFTFFWPVLIPLGFYLGERNLRRNSNPE